MVVLWLLEKYVRWKKYNEGKSETCDFFLEYISDFSDDLYVVIIQIINKMWNSNEND